MTSHRIITLGELVDEARTSPLAAKHVGAITSDSRKVASGSVFFAVPGTKADGLTFADQAVRAGAVAVIGETEPPGNLPFVKVPDVRLALARAASRFYPQQPAMIVAVTGTSGKSSVADFVRQLFAFLGHKSASLGTLGVITSDGTAYGSLTTPDPVSLHANLERLASDGVTHLAMEASSHGIDQRRLDGVRLSAAAFTNLGRDHLDYHGNTEAYAAAKLRLFDTLLPADAPAIVNADGPYADVFREGIRRRGLTLLTTGSNGEMLRLIESRPDGFGQKLAVAAFGKTYQTSLPLLGAFQVENALLAAGLVLSVEGEGKAAQVLEGLASLRGVVGRLESDGDINGALCIVDYAHKPDALAHVLDALRPFTKGRLVCVLGCGGDRDRGKRPLMGRIASDKADVVIVTDDNPRSEDPAAIRAEILKAAPNAVEIADRATAIRKAVHDLNPGDVLVVAGKGHATGQIVGDQTLPFSDHEEVRAAIAESRS